MDVITSRVDIGRLCSLKRSLRRRLVSPIYGRLQRRR